MPKPKNYIVLYADETDTDIWQDYCDACNVPYTATQITIYFTDNNVKYEE